MWHEILKWIGANPSGAGVFATMFGTFVVLVLGLINAAEKRQERIDTQRKEAEKQAKEEKDAAEAAKLIVSGIDENLLLEKQIATAGVAIITADKDLKIMRWTEAATALFGWSSTQMVGESVERIIPPSLKDKHRAGVARYKRTGEYVVIDAGPVALRALHRDGHEIPVTLNLGTDETTDGTIYYVGVIIPVPPPTMDAPTLKEVEEKE